jgi:His-Xaa-Ser system protein HxsD
MAGDIATVDNLEIDRKRNAVTISVNPKFYSLDVVHSAIYVMLDDHYFRIDGDPADEILVTIKPKKKAEDLESVGRKFNNELINYAVVNLRGEKTKDIRAAIIQRALQSHMGDDDEGKKDPS